jgi:hypothetical protein
MYLLNVVHPSRTISLPLPHSQDVEPQVPLRLCEGDVITVGSTELMVHISDLSEDSSNKENSGRDDDSSSAQQDQEN